MFTFNAAVLFFSAVISTADTGKCPSLSGAINKQITEFEDEHKYLNLTLDCNAVKEADLAVERLLNGQASHVDSSWCQFYRTVFDFLAFAEMFLNPALLEMPWDKIRRTALLHQNTKYGCAYRSSEAFMGYYYTTVCIYKRKKGEDRCFCN